MKRSHPESPAPHKRSKLHPDLFSVSLLPPFIYSELAVYFPVQELLLSLTLVCRSWDVGFSSKVVWDEVKKRDLGLLYEKLASLTYREAIKNTYLCYPDPVSNRICWIHPTKRSISWSNLPENTQIRRKSSWLILKSADLFICGGCKANTLVQNMQLLTLYDSVNLVSLSDMSCRDLESLPEVKMMLPLVEVEQEIYAFGGISATGWSVTAHKYDRNTEHWRDINPLPRPHLSFAPVRHAGQLYLVCGDGLEAYNLQIGVYRTVLQHGFACHNLAWLIGDDLYIADPVLVIVNLRSFQMRVIGPTPLRSGMWWPNAPFLWGDHVYMGKQNKVLCMDLRRFSWDIAVESL